MRLSQKCHKLSARDDIIYGMDENCDAKKAEIPEYKDRIMSNDKAKEALLWAKKRLNKFYNPKLHEHPPKWDLDDATSSLADDDTKAKEWEEVKKTMRH